MKKYKIKNNLYYVTSLQTFLEFTGHIYGEDWSSFFVPCDDTPDVYNPVRNLTAHPNGIGQLNLTWKPPDLDSTLFAAFSYVVTYVLHRHDACLQHVDLSGEISVNDTEVVLTGLEDFAIYSISVIPRTKSVRQNVNITVEGLPVQIVQKTLPSAPSRSPNIMVDGESTTQTSLTFTWDPVSCEDLNGVFIQYTYSFHQTDSDVIIAEGSIREQSLRRITFKGLTACTNYTFNIRVDNDAFNGKYNTKYATTSLSIPGNETNLILKPGTNDTCADGNTCLIATWQKPGSSSCPVDYQMISLHQIDVDNCRDTSPELISSSDFGSDQLEHVFSRLNPNSLYRATLSLGNSMGSVATTRELRAPEGGKLLIFF
ncbi:hypothetical protein HOLleu_29174 [Holothuria leucospilota]|uniref:Fibronectin type-III domain-containing protein n=1 Tax=Holothuria leucospilota TaxID=206669 RepID=A0A9Q1BN44_HOLLE|nr:hypothetical protein HOLleu_29174 [Holothuria leucospilota]